MPFKSEKQRRFLWAAHPDLAKRWAHEYPMKKKLPMYANKDKTDEKKETTYKQSAVNSVALDIYRKLSKKADTKEVYIEQPASDKPTIAGENPPKVVKTKSERCNSEIKPNNEVNPLLAKISAVLSQPIMQAIENEKAEMEARMASRMPANAGIKRYAMPAMGTPLPMGMQAQAPQGQAQAPAAQPQQTNPGGDKQQQAQQVVSQIASLPKPEQDAQIAQIQQRDPELGQMVAKLLNTAAQPANMGSPAPSGQLPPVGGGSSPNANPINSYGAISSTGEINGNAAFGTAHSVGGEKMAGLLSSIGRMAGKAVSGVAKKPIAAAARTPFKMPAAPRPSPVPAARPPAVPARPAVAARPQAVPPRPVPQQPVDLLAVDEAASAAYKRRAAPQKPITGRDVYTDPDTGWQYDGSWARPKPVPPTPTAPSSIRPVSPADFAARFGKKSAADTKKKEPVKPGLGHSMGWLLGGNAATNAAIGVPLTAYMNRVARPEMNAAPTPESAQAWQQLRDYATNQGVDVTDSLNVASKIDPKLPPKATGNWFSDFMSNMKHRMRRSAADSVRNTPAFYTPANPGIGISKPTIGHSPRMSNPGVLAHEIGHHMGGKALMYGNRIGRPAIGLGTAGALLSNNEDNSRNSALAGTAGAVPMLASEFDASRRGAKLMRQMKLKGGRSAFIGLPTYMMASSAPLLAHYGKKTLGGFKADAATRQPSGKPGR
jgi:hypothetical protein